MLSFPQLIVVLATLWFCVQLIMVWVRWNVRKLYRGPQGAEEPEERIGRVLARRLIFACCWTALLVPVVMCVYVYWTGRTTVVPRPLSPALVVGLLANEHIVWLSCLIFSFSTSVQLPRLWKDLNVAEETLLRNPHTQPHS